jgi:hypothetical protein
VVVCGSCGVSFAGAWVDEVGVLAPGSKPSRPGPEVATAAPAAVAAAKPARSLPRIPKPAMPQLPKLSRPRLPSLPVKRPDGFQLPSLPRIAAPTMPAYAAVPVALVAVIGGLILIQAQGGRSSTTSPAAVIPPDATTKAPSAAPASPAAAASGSAGTSGDAKLIRGSNFTIALPPGWQQTTPANGATFAAVSPDGKADATLWVRDEPKLDFPTFEATSLAQLRSLAGSAHVASRVAAPTPDDTIVRLAADAPVGKPAYEVTLRVFGPYRYYLATTLQPDASADTAKGVELLSNSLTPSDGSLPAAAPASSGGGR